MVSICTAAPSGDHNQRPRFQSAEHWLDHYFESTSGGHRPWAPITYDELLLADSEGVLESHPEWIPCAAQLRHWGLPPNFGRQQHSYSETFKERFLASLNTDPMFASAVFMLIRGEG